MENSLHVFHRDFSSEILSADLKLLASQGFSQIDGISQIDGKVEENFHSPSYLEDGPSGFADFNDQSGDKCRK